MQNFAPGRAVVAGFLATAFMTVLAHVTPLVGLPKMDFAAMLGSLFTEGVILGFVAAEQAVPLPGTEHEMVESRERRHGMPDFR
jgi:hypothetical protein